MARKNFKSGLGKLIKDSSIDIKEETQNDENQDDKEQLKLIISQLKKELHLWRTGELTVDIFEKSIAEYKLKYDPQNNEFLNI